MFETVRRLIIKHTGMVIIISAIILALIVIAYQMITNLEVGVDITSGIVATIDNNEASPYNNKILTGSQVLDAINKYYNNSDVIMILFNNSSDYNDVSCRFFVTGKTAKFAQNNNYDNVIISNNYEDITKIVVQDSLMNYLENYKKVSLNSYSSSSSKNYVSLVSKYKATLIKCNNANVGMAFFRID